MIKKMLFKKSLAIFVVLSMLICSIPSMFFVSAANENTFVFNDCTDANKFESISGAQFYRIEGGAYLMGISPNTTDATIAIYGNATDFSKYDTIKFDLNAAASNWGGISAVSVSLDKETWYDSNNLPSGWNGATQEIPISELGANTANVSKLYIKFTGAPSSYAYAYVYSIILISSQHDENDYKEFVYAWKVKEVNGDFVSSSIENNNMASMTTIAGKTNSTISFIGETVDLSAYDYLTVDFFSYGAEFQEWVNFLVTGDKFYHYYQSNAPKAQNWNTVTLTIPVSDLGSATTDTFIIQLQGVSSWQRNIQIGNFKLHKNVQLISDTTISAVNVCYDDASYDISLSLGKSAIDVELPYNVNEAVITPKLFNSKSTIKVDGNAKSKIDVSMSGVDERSFTIVVASENGNVEKTYRVNVFRGKKPYISEYIFADSGSVDNVEGGYISLTPYGNGFRVIVPNYAANTNIVPDSDKTMSQTCTVNFNAKVAQNFNNYENIEFSMMNMDGLIQQRTMLVALGKGSQIKKWYTFELSSKLATPWVNVDFKIPVSYFLKSDANDQAGACYTKEEISSIDCITILFRNGNANTIYKQNAYFSAIKLTGINILWLDDNSLDNIQGDFVSKDYSQYGDFQVVIPEYNSSAENQICDITVSREVSENLNNYDELNFSMINIDSQIQQRTLMVGLGNAEQVKKWYTVDLSDKMSEVWQYSNFAIPISYYLEADSSTGECYTKEEISEIDTITLRFAGGESGMVYSQIAIVKDLKLSGFKNFKLDSIYNSGMLFQQNKDIVITGDVDNDAVNIKAELYKNGNLIQTSAAVLDAETLRFKLNFDAQRGGYDKYQIRFYQDNVLSRIIDDILIGELWLSSGQSNMELPVFLDMQSSEIVSNANNKNVRIMNMPTWVVEQDSLQPIDPLETISSASWVIGNDQTSVEHLQSLPYNFAKKLQEEIDVPVGVITTAVGATSIEAWMPREAIEGNNEIKTSLKKLGMYYDESNWSHKGGTMSTLYNSKIAPLKNLGIAGTIWYQGEGNANNPSIYSAELDLLKEHWGKLFGFNNDSMPFVFTQIAPFVYDSNENPYYTNPINEAMTDAFMMNSDKNMAMVTIYDLPLDHMKNGETSNAIHPRYKVPVAERFAKSAISLVYNKSTAFTAPIYKSMEKRDNAIYVTFDYVGDGLKSVDASKNIHGFTICGADNVYVNAKAKIINKNTVKVWNDNLTNPTNVCYAYSVMNQESNLGNSNNIPAAPFCSDKNYASTENVKFFAPQDWMHFDCDAWVYDSQNTAEQCLGVRPSFTVSAVLGGTNAQYSYNTDIKKEGAASLKLSYSANMGTVGVSPILRYESLHFNAENYRYLTVSVANPDAHSKDFSLLIKSGNNVYTILTDSGNSSYHLSAKSDFVDITFDLTKIVDANNIAVSNASSVLSNLSDLQFTVTDDNEGIVYIDGVYVGLNEKSENIIGDFNGDKAVDSDDLIMLKKALLGVDNITVDYDLNDDNALNVLDFIKLQKMIVK